MNFALKQMRKVNQEIKDEQVLSEILSAGSICRIAILDGDLPYIVPVNYGYSDGTLYIHSAPEGKKIDLLCKDNRVCFEVEHSPEVIKGKRACDWTTRYRSVVGYGTIDMLSDKKSKQHGLKVIMTQHGATGPMDFTPKSLDRMVILKLTITSLTGKQSSIW